MSPAHILSWSTPIRRFRLSSKLTLIRIESSDGPVNKVLDISQNNDTE